MHWPKLAISSLFGLFLSCSAAQAEFGFFPANSPQLPEVIRQSAAKVLRIWTPAGYAMHPESQYDSILRALDQIEEKEQRQQVKWRMARVDVQRCKQRLLPFCRITNQVSWGSAFLLEDGSLIAARHDFLEEESGLFVKFANLVEDWSRDGVLREERARVIEDIAAFKRNPFHDLMFVLTDANKDVVFDSAQQGFRVLRFGFLSQFRGLVNLEAGKVGVDGDNPKIQALKLNGVDWVNGDSVRIQLSVSHLPRLKTAARGSCQAGRIAIAGFAGRSTTTRQVFGARDPVANELSVTIGSILSLPEAIRRTRNLNEATRETFAREAQGIPTLLTDADATKGLSGGPILNMRGEVCGMVRGLYPSDESPNLNEQTGILDLVTFGVPLENLTGI